MSTINLSGITFTVKYVDPSITSAGDGSTPSLALLDLPEFSSLNNNTAYLIRRPGGSYKLTFPTGTSSTSSLNYAFIGMPKSTDPMYEMIPSEAKTAWGSDSSSVDYAYVNVGSTGFTLSGSNIIFNSYRLYFYHNGLTSSPSTGMFNFSSTDYTNLITFENCRFGYLGYELDSNELSVSALEINESKELLYKATDSGDSDTNGKYYLYSGTAGDEDAVYYNLNLKRKICYESSSGRWFIKNISNNTIYFVSNNITDSWNPISSSFSPPPTVSSISESLSYKISVVGGVENESGKYYVSSGTHGSENAEYTNGSYVIYYDTNNWYMKQSGSSSAEYTGPLTKNSPFGDYTKSASWSSVPSYGMKGYISCGKIRSFEMRGCKINFNANCNSSSIMYAITISNKKNCSISNTDVNIVCATNNQNIENIFALYTDSTSTQNSYDNENYTHLYGLTFNLFKYAPSSSQINYIPFCILDHNSSFVEAKNISVSMLPQNQIGTGTVTTLEVFQKYNASLSCAYGVFVLNKVHNFDIDGVTISLPQFWKVGVNLSYDSSSLFIVRSNDENYPLLSSSPGQMNIIKNITISCAQGSGNKTYDGLDSESEIGNYYSNISNSTFAQPMSCIRLYNSSKHIWDISNISISNPHGVAAEIYGCWFEADSVSGTIRANSNSTVNIGTLSTWYAGKAIGIFGNATVKVDTLTCGIGGLLKPEDELACLGEIYSSQGFLYVGTSNRQLLTDTRMTSSSYSNAYSAICANEKYTGRYMMRTENYLCSTYGVFRTSLTSTVSATLKLQNNWCNASTGIVLGQSPFGGFQKTISSSGKQVLYIYGATLELGSKNDVFAAIGRNIIVEVIIPTSSGKRSVFSTSGSWVLDTTSTWSDQNISATDNNATGFPVYLKLPLNIDTGNSSVDIKIYYNWYSLNGAFFLDPSFEVKNADSSDSLS